MIILIDVSFGKPYIPVDNGVNEIDDIFKVSALA